MICPNCGTELNEGEEFCYNCGTRVAQPTPPPYTPQQSAPTPPPYTPPQQSAPTPPPYIPPQQPVNTPVQSGKTNGIKTQNIIIGVMLGVIVIMAAFLAFYITRSRMIDSLQDNPIETTTAIATAVPTASVTTRPNVTAVPTAAPTQAAAIVNEHSYTVIVSTMTWEAARQYAESTGGYLVAINDRTEFDRIKALLSDSRYSNVRNVWIGACAPPGINTAEAARAYWNSSDARWVNGDPFTFAQWRDGEPSGYDFGLNAPERYLQIFRPKADNYEWSFNDGGDDLSEYKDGSLAFIIEYER